MTDTLNTTVFTQFHDVLGAKFVPFAGYQMPVSFAGGIAEHTHVREGNAGLFDVSHMGQITLQGNNIVADFERLIPSNIQKLQINHAKYTVLMNSNGGIIDDCIVTKISDNELFLVVNGSRKHDVLHHLKNELYNNIINYHENYGLLALQGKAAVDILSHHIPKISDLKFMQMGQFQIADFEVRISRTGYTGEDGFEISVNPLDAEKLYTLITHDKNVQSIGLGARDTLRLEAGLCLYGNDIDMTTSPLEANLGWVIDKQRTENLAYIGADRVKSQMINGIERKRVGLLPQTKAPIRADVELFDADDNKIGVVTSGTFSPTLQRPIAMGYIHPKFSVVDTQIFAELRGKKIPVTIAKMPFVKNGYAK